MLKSVFSPRPDRIKNESESMQASEKIERTVSLKSDGAATASQKQVKTMDPQTVLKYRHAAAQTDHQPVRSRWWGTDDVIQADEAEKARLSKERWEYERELSQADEQADQELPRLMGKVSIRRRSSQASVGGGSMDSLKLPRVRTRFIKFDQVAVLLDAAGTGDLAELKSLFEGSSHPLHVDSCTEDGVTALHAASSACQRAVIEYLVKRGAHVNAIDSQGNTPLHVAAQKGDLEIVQLLVQAGGSVEAENHAGRTASQATPFSDIREYLRLVQERKRVSEQVTAIYDFNRMTVMDGRGDELSVERGTKLKVLDRSDPDWWLVERMSDGSRGFVPRMLVQ